MTADFYVPEWFFVAIVGLSYVGAFLLGAAAMFLYAFERAGKEE